MHIGFKWLLLNPRHYALLRRVKFRQALSNKHVGVEYIIAIGVKNQLHSLSTFILEDMNSHNTVIPFSLFAIAKNKLLSIQKLSTRQET